MSSLEIRNDSFYVGNEPVQLISGGMHYFRIVPAYWEDRLRKLKACGFNCVETYIPWNFHEPEEGKFTFSGTADVEAFIRVAQRVGLYVIVRPGPYICAEWEFGGLPGWLLRENDLHIRSYDELFLEKMDAYFDVLLPKLQPLLQTNGGPIIAMQIENEYGSYGNDQAYLQYVKHALESREIDVLLFTSDGSNRLNLESGTLDGVLPTVNFGSLPEEHFANLERFAPGVPKMVMEFWCGWFDHWGEEHHVRDAGDVADTFRAMLADGASVNFFMFHGGTNFGFWNGANHEAGYQPTVTSYDYDALLTESGDITAKYRAVRETIAEHFGQESLPLPEPVKKQTYGDIRLTEKVTLFHALEKISTPVTKNFPVPMEKVDQYYGFILYRTNIKGPMEELSLEVGAMHDRALVYVNGSYQGILDRFDKRALLISSSKEDATLDILVENMGRVNYGTYLSDPKGIIGGVQLGRQYLYDWEIFPLPMDEVEHLPFTEKGTTLTATSLFEEEDTEPAFYKGYFQVDTIADTFVYLPGWVKGFVVINGFNIGRYWEIGPQETLYLPGPLLKTGENEIIIFELHRTEQAQISLIDQAILG